MRSSTVLSLPFSKYSQHGPMGQPKIAPTFTPSITTVQGSQTEGGSVQMTSLY
jgi:hypothetical protein